MRYCMEPPLLRIGSRNRGISYGGRLTEGNGAAWSERNDNGREERVAQKALRYRRLASLGARETISVNVDAKKRGDCWKTRRRASTNLTSSRCDMYSFIFFVDPLTHFHPIETR